MTLLGGVLSVLVAVAIASGLSSIGNAAVTDARVQLAADAAALAAVAEAGPGGTGQPAAMAQRFAQDNGARLVSCICAPDATAVQVTVAIGDHEARARAVFDPTLVRPSMPEVDTRGSS